METDRFADWILESLGTGVVAIDAGGDVVRLNDGARRLLGCVDEHGVPGRPCREVLESEPTVAQLLLDGLSGGGALSRAELVLRGDASRRASTIGFTLAPVRDERGCVRGAAMIFRDLSAFERADEQERLRERLAALGEMAAGLAHEIRNPLAGIELLAGLLKRRLGDRPEDLKLVVELMEELRELARTVSAGLDFVRPLAPARTPMDPVALVEDSLRLARLRVPFDGDVERDYAPHLPEVSADADQLRGVVTNLIVNAFEAMRVGGAAPPQLALRVSTRRGEAGRPVRVDGDGQRRDGAAAPADELAIEVADRGPGVPDELRERIFYPFFTTRERGSGVGLATAQKIAASHGGVVEVANRVGGGAVFRLRIPVDGGPT